MPQKILAPLDGSSLACGVLPHVIALTRAEGGQVTLVRVMEAPPDANAHLDPVDWQLRKAEAQAYLAEMAARLAPYKLDVTSEVLEGPIAERIIEFAHHNDSDLIALSSHGQSGLTGWTISGVAQKIIQRARRSILFVPAYHSSAMGCQDGDLGSLRYRRILVPLDGSPRAECVLGRAEALARQHDAALLLVHVVTPPYMLQRLPLTDEDHELIRRVMTRNRNEAERYFEQLKGRLSPEPCAFVIEHEHAPSALQAFIRQEQVDLVFLAAHGYVHEDKRPYGNLAANLITYGAVPIIVVQDLAHHEIEPTQAELAFSVVEYSVQGRLNAPQS